MTLDLVGKGLYLVRHILARDLAYPDTVKLAASEDCYQNVEVEVGVDDQLAVDEATVERGVVHS